MTEGGAAPPSPTATRHAPSQSTASRMAAIDPLSDKATILLIRRTLCPRDQSSAATTTTSTGATTAAAAAPTSDSTPIEELLPPLTSRNDVDLQLYALLAVVVREFVLTWYAKITPDDDQFVTELVQIVAHCTRALEQRLRRVDLESLLLDEIPQLLDNHVRAYRASRTVIGPAAAAAAAAGPTVSDARTAYHALWPLPALSPVPPLLRDSSKSDKSDKSQPRKAKKAAEQAANEAAYRQLLVGGLLAVLLPTEDLENECLTALVGQIVSELLIGNVLARRVAEPWMMWEIVGLVAKIVRDKMGGGGGGGSDAANSDAHAKQAARRRRAAVRRKDDAKEAAAAAVAGAGAGAEHRLAAAASQAVLSVLNAGFVLFAAVRFLVASFTLSRSLPPRGARSMGSIPRPTATGLADSSLLSSDAEEPVVPVLSFSVWAAVCSIVQLQVRMPWLYGALSMLGWLALAGPGRIAALNRPLDRLLSHYIHRYALAPALLPTLLRSIRGAMFPGNKFGAAPPTLVEPATDEELAALKRRTAEAVYAVWGGGRSGSGSKADKDKDGAAQKEAPPAVLNEIEGSLLDIFDDAYCNKHLLYSIVEAVFVRLVPELAETGVLGLWEERLS